MADLHNAPEAGEGLLVDFFFGEQLWVVEEVT